jgi:FixJ family two-component response regulator
MTGHGDMTTTVKALQKGADDYLCKPCDIEELNFRIERCLEKQDHQNKMCLTGEALRQAHDLLELKVKERTRDLKEANTALTVLLKKRDQDKKHLEEQILANAKELIIPYLEKLKRTPLTQNQHSFLEIVDKNLQELTSPFIRSLSSKFFKLTPAELQVANLVRHGMTTKKIADVLTLSIETINNHRKHIRKKSGITNKKVNLHTILASFSDS